jgi:hypothetical protein
MPASLTTPAQRFTSSAICARAPGTLPAEYLFLLLAPGPALGLIALRPLLRTDQADRGAG